MKCIECGSQANCTETREVHPPGEKFPAIRRQYVCTNEECGTAFYHLSQYITGKQAKHLRDYLPPLDRSYMEGK